MVGRSTINNNTGIISTATTTSSNPPPLLLTSSQSLGSQGQSSQDMEGSNNSNSSNNILIPPPPPLIQLTTMQQQQQLIMDDELDNGMSDTDSDELNYGGGGGADGSGLNHDLMNDAMEDEITAQLAAAGPVGMAAAAAIASAKKRKRPHTFETNPSIRKRQQTRLLRKLKQTIDEFTIRVGMQAVVLVTIPGKTTNSYKCFGAKPLEDVIRNLKPVIMQDLESALAQQTPILPPDDPTLHELPPLVIDGIPTPVEKMTQAQLRAFIPLMLKFSTGRGKPGWGKESTRPPWWPVDLPWANVRMDARTEDDKQKVSWTHALRQIVINCYHYHGRNDLLPVFSSEAGEGGAGNGEEVEIMNISGEAGRGMSGEEGHGLDVKPSKLLKASHHKTSSSNVHAMNNSNNIGGPPPLTQATTSGSNIIKLNIPSSSSHNNNAMSSSANIICTSATSVSDLINTASGGGGGGIVGQQQHVLSSHDKMYQICEFLKVDGLGDKMGGSYTIGGSGTHGSGTGSTTVLQTISNPDGTVSIIQVDPTNTIITLPDGTRAQVQGVATLQQQHHGDSNNSLIEQHGGNGNNLPLTVDLGSLGQHISTTESGQLILTSEDGTAYPVTVSGMITMPMSSNSNNNSNSMYATVLSQLQQQQGLTTSSGSGSQTIQSKRGGGNISSRGVGRGRGGGGGVGDGRRGPRVRMSKLVAAALSGGGRNNNINSVNNNNEYETIVQIDALNNSINSTQTGFFEIDASMVTPMLLPKIEPGTEHLQGTTTIPVSVLTGDPSQTQLLTVSASGQVLHEDKVYQICEFYKPEDGRSLGLGDGNGGGGVGGAELIDDKGQIIMMTTTSQESQEHESQQQQQQQQHLGNEEGNEQGGGNEEGEDESEEGGGNEQEMQEIQQQQQQTQETITTTCN